MHFHGIESSKNVMKDLTIKKKLWTWSFEFSLIFSPLIVSSSF